MRGTTAELRVRPMRPTDEAFVLGLSRQVFAAYSIQPIRAMASMLADPSAAALVAELNGERAGFFVLSLDALGRPFGPWQRPVIARLDAIAVDPDAQGRGVGRFLLARAEALARARGAVVMALMTAEKNHPARRLFTSAGFLELVRIPVAYARGQTGVTMNKPL
jgi:GNAT superfamily N-acetyltransferase